MGAKKSVLTGRHSDTCDRSFSKIIYFFEFVPESRVFTSLKGTDRQSLRLTEAAELQAPSLPSAHRCF